MVLVLRQNLKFEFFWIFFDFQGIGSKEPTEIIDKSETAFLLAIMAGFWVLLLEDK
jgi:hypothetical protein